MERDETYGIIRPEVVAEVLAAVMQAVETSRCTLAEEAVAIGVLLEWVENQVPEEDMEDIPRVRAFFHRLWKVKTA